MFIGQGKFVLNIISRMMENVLYDFPDSHWDRPNRVLVLLIKKKVLPKHEYIVQIKVLTNTPPRRHCEEEQGSDAATQRFHNACLVCRAPFSRSQ